MANKTATQLVTRTEELLQIFGDARSFRHGFAGDTNSTATPILASVNDFLAMLQPTGIRTGPKSQNTAVGDNEYDVSQELGEIYSVRWNGKPLRETTEAAEDERNPGWTNAANGVTERYIREGSSMILLPTPNAIAPLIMRGTLPIPPLIATTDPLLYIPEHLQSAVPYGAALLHAHVDAENTAHVRRIGEYRAIALNMVRELLRISRPQDFSSTMSLDTWVEGAQYPREEHGRLMKQFVDMFGLLAPSAGAMATSPTG